MTSTTLNSRHLANAPHNVGDALHDLALAARQLAVALWASATQRSTSVLQALTAAQEAEDLRNMASELLRTDPRFASELFAAADRHEHAAAASAINRL